ncbi:MAG TPA: WD40 repeat domain-containing protein [Tepidisphaeraceae bacterium]|nr:WD40 repeat domain-containing protein [Tepidisphaeraceae bacterium]
MISIACGWANAQTLQLVRTIPLPNVEGRIDHMSLCGDRLYIGAVGNNSLEVVDLKAGKWLQSIGDLPEAQGVRCSDALGRLFVGTGGDGACHIFDSQSLKPVKTVKLGDDADNVRIDEKANQIFVGYGEGAIAVIDAMTGERINNIKLPGHPESFQLERNGNRIFVNVPSAEEVAVIDRARGQVTANWRVTEAKANFPMALDEVHGRLLIVCRKPARLIVKDTTSGKTVATLDCCGDADDIFYDDKSKQIFISGGDGHIDVIIQKDLDHYDRPATISTAVGARTSLWSPEKRQLYLAVPHRGNQRAEIRVYELK